MSTALCIYIHEGRTEPVVFSTALVPADDRRLAAWLDENPQLARIADEAVALTERPVGGDLAPALPEQLLVP